MSCEGPRCLLAGVFIREFIYTLYTLPGMYNAAVEHSQHLHAHTADAVLSGCGDRRGPEAAWTTASET
jgi:hypothetical protein